MKQSCLVLLLCLTSLVSFAADLTSPVGKWKTIDDETKLPKSIVEITEVDGKIQGKIVQLFRKPEEDQNPVCDKCEDSRKDQPVLGMMIFEGLKKDGEYWTDGKILDPKKGKLYSVKMRLTDEGKKFDVRGYIGFSLLGRTQTWERQD